MNHFLQAYRLPELSVRFYRALWGGSFLSSPLVVCDSKKCLLYNSNFGCEYHPNFLAIELSAHLDLWQLKRKDLFVCVFNGCFWWSGFNMQILKYVGLRLYDLCCTPSLMHLSWTFCLQNCLLSVLEVSDSDLCQPKRFWCVLDDDNNSQHGQQ